MVKNKILTDALNVLRIEKNAISGLEKRLDGSFTEAVEAIYKCKGRIIITGMGKSGIIALKIAATFNSTGTPSVFLHSADSVHGDLGIILDGDIVLCISKSGESLELLQMLNVINEKDVKVISILGDKDSGLQELSDIVIDASVEKEACPHNLAPTSSTTAAMVIGDALAICLLNKREFSKEEFAELHPGGILGKKLNLKVGSLMVKNTAIPQVKENSSFKDIIFEISSKRLGCTCVVKNNKKLSGIITDGDIRRYLEKRDNLNGILAKDIMNTSPKTIDEKMLANTALEFMEKYSIMQLIIIDKKKIPVGMVHLHDIVKSGLG